MGKRLTRTQIPCSMSAIGFSEYGEGIRENSFYRERASNGAHEKPNKFSTQISDDLF